MASRKRMTTSPCPQCGEPADPEDLFCAGCGEELPPAASEQPTCQNCGEVRDPDDLFCAGCGQKLPELPPVGAATAPPTESEKKRSPAARKKQKAATSKRSPKSSPQKPRKPPAKKAKRSPATKAPKTRAKSGTAPTRQGGAAAPETSTRRISRWWPVSSGGRTAFLAILLASGIFGVVAGEGNPMAGLITAAMALVLLTFWRNVWISWSGGATRVSSETQIRVPSGRESPPPPPAQTGGGETLEDSGGGTLEKVVGIAILLGLLALVKAFGPQIVGLLF
jgi:hypothetical protein